jgi:3-oxoadipate enol-lactonase
MADLLAASPQDLTHADFELPVKPALPRLQEIRVPTLLLVGDADIPDVHAHAGAIEAGVPRSRRIVLSTTQAIFSIWNCPTNSQKS